MVVVGEAVVRLRVISDRLASDIREAVKKGLSDANADIDAEGEKAGDSFGEGVKKGIRKQTKKIGKEIELTARRFTADASGVIDDEGDRLGRQFTTSISKGLSDSGGWAEVVRVTQENFERVSENVRTVGEDAGKSYTDGVRRQLTAGMKEIGPGIQDDVRRAFHMRPGDIDDDGEIAAQGFGDGIDKGLRSRFAKVRQSVDDMANDMASRLGNNYRSFQDFGSKAATNVRDSFRNQMKEVRQSIKDEFTGITRNLRLGLPDFDRVGREAGEATTRGVRRGLLRDRATMFKAFSGLGGDFMRHFNLGIGAARMGPAIISLVALAAPSVLSAAAGLATALGAQLVSGIAALGPAVAGAGGVAAAGLATLALNVGLVMAAFKAGNPEIDAATEKLKGLGKVLGTPIANGMAKGFTSFVDDLGSVLPQINDLLAETGAAFGRVFTKLGETIKSGDNLDRIRGILATNNSFIDKFGDGLAGLTTSFLILWDAAKPFIDAIGNAIAQFGTWAQATLEAKEANGELASFMETTLARFKEVASSIGDVLVGLYNIGKAAEPFGRSMGDLSEKFRAWTESDTGQEKMTKFFEKAHILAGGLADMFSGIGSAFANAFINIDPGPILEVFRIIGDKMAPALAELWNQVQSGAGQNLVKIFDNLATALQKIADNGSFEIIAKFISDMLVKISEFIASDFGATIAGWLIPLTLFGGLFTSLIGPITTVLGLLSGPALAVAAVIAAIAGFFVLVWTQSEAFRTSIEGLVTTLGGTFSSIWDEIWPKVQRLWEVVVKLAQAVGDRLGPVIEFLTPIIAAAFETLGTIFGFIIDHVTEVIDFVANILNGDWAAAWDNVVAIVQNVWDLLVDLFGDIIAGIGEWFGKIPEVLGGVWERIEDGAVKAWEDLLTWLEGIWNDIVAAATQIWSNITGFFSGIWNDIVVAAEQVWTNITDSFSKGWEGLKSFFSTLGGELRKIWDVIWAFAVLPLEITWNLIMLIWNGIKDGLFEAWNWIKTKAEEIWNGIKDFFGGIWNGVSEAATEAWDIITTELSEKWEGVKTKASEIWNGITEFFSGIWDGIATKASEVWETVSTFLSEKWESIRLAAETAWNTITTFFAGIWDGISAKASEVWDTITTFLSEKWEGIRVAAETVWNTVSTFFTTKWNEISATFHSIVDPLVDWLGQRWNDIKAAAETVWNNISSFFSTKWTEITNIFHTAVEAVKQWLSDRWEDIKSAAQTAWDTLSGLARTAWENVSKAIHEVVDPILGWLSERWEDIKSAVTTAFDALAGPVRAAWDAVYSAIVEPVVNAFTTLNGWITSIKELIQGAWDFVTGKVDDINAKIGEAATAQAEFNAAHPGGDAGIFAPAAAEGGILRPTPGGQMVRVAEAGQAERIEPLDATGLSQRDHAIIEKLSGAVGGGNTIIVKIGETELTQIVDTRVVRNNERTGRSLRNGVRV
jgi:phage-related protein